MKWFRDQRRAAWFIVGVSLLHALYNISLPFYPDEAYYWLWSRHLDFSYYDHPPMVAYLIRLFSFGGDNLFLIRLSTVFCMGVAVWFIYRLALHLRGPRVAALALLIGLLLPATNLGYTLITPDSPLIMFWAMALYYCYLAVSEDRWRDYLLAGLSLGGLLLSKYTSVLFLGFLLLFLLLRRPKRLLQLKPWLALLLAFVVFSPVIYWNANHDWISFSFQYQHGTSGDFGINLKDFLGFFAGLFVIFSPVFFAVLLRGLARVRDYWRDDGLLYIALGTLFPLGFFLYKGLFKKMELNWVAVALVPAVIFLAWFIDNRGLHRTMRIGNWICVLLMLLLFVPSLLFLPAKLNPHNRFFGFKEVATEMSHLIQPGDSLFADYLTSASILTYYLPGHPRVAVPISKRLSQFNFWDRDLDYAQLSGLCLASRKREAALRKVFAQVTLVERFVARAPGLMPQDFYIYRCSGAEAKVEQ